MNAVNECAPLPPIAPDFVTWIHIGDLHMVQSGEQNFLDLQAIVEEINTLFADKGVSFVYLPGDNADDGSEKAYTAVRACLDKLQLPWCAIVGDHDVHEKSFRNFEHSMCTQLYGSFTVGQVRFFRLNCFSEPRPDSFIVSIEQLAWLEAELERSSGMRCVVLMHCYPSDLKQGGDALTALIHRYGIKVVDMGHTHYNELSNDGRTIYAATRSTGQIEEGPVGYSVVTLDGDSVSWHFKRLGTPALVSITNPQDIRLQTNSDTTIQKVAEVRALAWSRDPVRSVNVTLGAQTFALAQNGTGVWSASLSGESLAGDANELVATLVDVAGSEMEDMVRVGSAKNDAVEARVRHERDQDNALGAWPDRDLLGTQLGPNKNGRKW